MKYLITRSYSRKIQIKQFEPFETFCSAQTEVELMPSDESPESIKEAMESASKDLDEFCRTEVAKTIEIVRPSSAPLGKVDKSKSNDVGKDSAEHEAGHEDDI